VSTGHIGVARNLDLGLAAGGEVYKSGELGLGFEGCRDVEGPREVDAPGLNWNRTLSQ